MKSDDAELRVANIPPFGLRLQPELKRLLEDAARRNGRSLNSEIAIRLEASLVPDFAASDISERVNALELQQRTMMDRLAVFEREAARKP